MANSSVLASSSEALSGKSLYREAKRTSPLRKSWNLLQSGSLESRLNGFLPVPSRAAHGVDEICLALPACHHDDASGKFAASGKKIRKKDLDMMAISYGYV